jgi:hypothetical protein
MMFQNTRGLHLSWAKACRTVLPDTPTTVMEAMTTASFCFYSQTPRVNNSAATGLGAMPAVQGMPSLTPATILTAMPCGSTSCSRTWGYTIARFGKASDPVMDGRMPSYPTTPSDFPLEDAWSDLLIKRLALEAARGGHRAIEVASPRQIADKVGGNIDNYEHFYGKVVPGAIERLGGKMGGLKRESAERLALPADPSEAVEAAIEAAVKDLPNAEMPDWAYQAARGRIRNAFNELAQEYASNTWRKSADIEGAAGFLHSRLRDAARQYGMPREAMDARMPQLMRAAEIAGAEIYARPRPPPEPDDAIRYLMSDEMRRNILRNGIPASVLGAAALSNERQP